MHTVNIEEAAKQLSKLVDEAVNGEPFVIAREGKPLVKGIFAAVPYCIDLIGGPYLETREEVVRAFRPKSAIRPQRT